MNMDSKHKPKPTSTETGVRNIYKKYSNIFRRHQIHQCLKRSGSISRLKSRSRIRNLFVPKFDDNESCAGGFQRYFNVYRGLDFFNQPLPFSAKDIETTLRKRRAFLVDLAKLTAGEKENGKEDKGVLEEDECDDEKEKRSDDADDNGNEKICNDRGDCIESKDDIKNIVSSEKNFVAWLIGHSAHDESKFENKTALEEKIKQALNFESPDGQTDLYKVRAVNLGKTNNIRETGIVKAIPCYKREASTAIPYSYYTQKSEPISHERVDHLINLDSGLNRNDNLTTTQSFGIQNRIGSEVRDEVEEFHDEIMKRLLFPESIPVLLDDHHSDPYPYHHHHHHSNTMISCRPDSELNLNTNEFTQKYNSNLLRNKNHSAPSTNHTTASSSQNVIINQSLDHRKHPTTTNIPINLCIDHRDKVVGINGDQNVNNKVTTLKSDSNPESCYELHNGHVTRQNVFTGVCQRQQQQQHHHSLKHTQHTTWPNDVTITTNTVSNTNNILTTPSTMAFTFSTPDNPQTVSTTSTSSTLSKPVITAISPSPVTTTTALSNSPHNPNLSLIQTTENIKSSPLKPPPSTLLPPQPSPHPVTQITETNSSKAYKGENTVDYNNENQTKHPRPIKRGKANNQDGMSLHHLSYFDMEEDGETNQPHPSLHHYHPPPPFPERQTQTSSRIELVQPKHLTDDQVHGDDHRLIEIINYNNNTDSSDKNTNAVRWSRSDDLHCGDRPQNLVQPIQDFGFGFRDRNKEESDSLYRVVNRRKQISSRRSKSSPYYKDSHEYQTPARLHSSIERNSDTPILPSDSVLFNNSFLDYSNGYCGDTIIPTQHGNNSESFGFFPEGFQSDAFNSHRDWGVRALDDSDRTSAGCNNDFSDDFGDCGVRRRYYDTANTVPVRNSDIPLPFSKHQNLEYEQQDGRMVLVSREMNDIMNKFMKDTESPPAVNQMYAMSTFGKLNGPAVPSNSLSSQSTAKELQRLRCRPNSSTTPSHDGWGGSTGVGPLKANHSITDSSLQYDREIAEINKNAPSSSSSTAPKTFNTHHRRPPPPPPPPPRPLLSSFSPPPPPTLSPPSSSSSTTTKRPMSAAPMFSTTHSPNLSDDDTAPRLIPSSSPTATTTNNSNSSSIAYTDDVINAPIRPRSASRRRAYIIKRPQSAPLFGKITPRTFTPDSDNTNNDSFSRQQSSIMTTGPQPKIVPNFPKGTISMQQPKVPQSFINENTNQNKMATITHQIPHPSHENIRTIDLPLLQKPSTLTNESQTKIVPNFLEGTVSIHPLQNTKSSIHSCANSTNNLTNNRTEITHSTFSNNITDTVSPRSPTPDLSILQEECSIDRKEHVTVRHVETIIFTSPRIKSDASITLSSSISSNFTDKSMYNSVSEQSDPELDHVAVEEIKNSDTNLTHLTTSHSSISEEMIHSCVSDTELKTCVHHDGVFSTKVEAEEASKMSGKFAVTPEQEINSHQSVLSSQICSSSNMDTDEADFFSSVIQSSTARDIPESYKNEVPIIRYDKDRLSDGDATSDMGIRDVDQENKHRSNMDIGLINNSVTKSVDNSSGDDLNVYNSRYAVTNILDNRNIRDRNNDMEVDYSSSEKNYEDNEATLTKHKEELGNRSSFDDKHDFSDGNCENNGVVQGFIDTDTCENKTEKIGSCTQPGRRGRVNTSDGDTIDIVADSGYPEPLERTQLEDEDIVSKDVINPDQSLISSSQRNTNVTLVSPTDSIIENKFDNAHNDDDDDDDIVIGVDNSEDVESLSTATAHARDVADLKDGHSEKGPLGEVFIPNLRLCSLVGSDSLSDSDDINNHFNQVGDVCDTSSDADCVDFKDGGDGNDDNVSDDDAFEDDAFTGSRLKKYGESSPLKATEGFNMVDSGQGENDPRFCDTDTMVDKIYIPALLGKIEEEEKSFYSERDDYSPDENVNKGVDELKIDLENDKPVLKGNEDENELVESETRNLRNVEFISDDGKGQCISENVERIKMSSEESKEYEIKKRIDVESFESETTKTITHSSAVLEQPKRYSSHTDDSDSATSKGVVLRRKLNKNGVSDPLPGLSEPLAADIDTDDEPVITMKKKSPFKRFFARKKGKYNPSTDFDMINSVLPTFEEKKESAKKTKSYSPTLSRKKKNKLTLESVKSVNVLEVEEKPKNAKKGKKEKDKIKVLKPGKIDKSNIVVIKTSGKSLSQSMVDVAGEQDTDITDHSEQLSPSSNLDVRMNAGGLGLTQDITADGEELYEHVPVEYVNLGEESEDVSEEASVNSENNINFDKLGKMSSPEFIESGNDIEADDVYENTSEALSSCTSSFVSPTSPEQFSSSSFDRQINYCDSSSDVAPSNPTDSDLGGDSEHQPEHFGMYPYDVSDRLKLNPLFSSPEPDSKNSYQNRDRMTNDMAGTSGSDLDQNKEECLKAMTSSASEFESDTLPASESDFDFDDNTKNNKGALQSSIRESSRGVRSKSGRVEDATYYAELSASNHEEFPSHARKLSSIETTESDNETDEALLAAASEFPLNRPKYGKVPILDEQGIIVKRHSETHLANLNHPEIPSAFDVSAEDDIDFASDFIPRAKLKKKKSIKRDRVECGDVSLEAESDHADFAAAILGISMDSSQDELDVDQDKDEIFSENPDILQSQRIDEDCTIVNVAENSDLKVKSSSTLHRSPSEVLVAAQVHRTILDDPSSSMSDSDAKVDDEEKDSGGGNKKNVGANEYLSSMGFAVKYLSNVGGVLEKDDSVDLETLDHPSLEKPSPLSQGAACESLGDQSNDMSSFVSGVGFGNDSHKTETNNTEFPIEAGDNEKEVTDSMLQFVGLLKENDDRKNDGVQNARSLTGAAGYYDDVPVVENVHSKRNDLDKGSQPGHCEDETRTGSQNTEIAPSSSLKLTESHTSELLPEKNVSVPCIGENVSPRLEEEERKETNSKLQMSMSDEFKMDPLDKRQNKNLEDHQEVSLAVEYSIVPFICDRTLLSRKQCKDGLTKLDKHVESEEIKALQCESRAKSPERSNGQRHSEIENKDLITGALKDLDDFVKGDLDDDNEENENKRALSIASIVEESNLSLNNDDEVVVSGSEFEENTEVVDDVMEKCENAPRNHSLPVLLASMATPSENQTYGRVDVGLSDGGGDTDETVDAVDVVRDERWKNFNRDDDEMIQENENMEFSLENNIISPPKMLLEGWNVENDNLKSQDTDTDVSVTVVHDEENDDHRDVADIPEIPLIPVSKRSKLSSVTDDTLRPASPQTSQTVLEEEYEEVVDKIEKSRKYSDNKLSYDEISDTAADNVRDEKPEIQSHSSPKKFVFPWKKKDKDNVEKTSSVESGKNEKSKSKSKEGKHSTNKDAKTKVDSKSKADGKQKSKSKGENTNMDKKTKKSKRQSPEDDDDVYHEIEDNKVDTSKTRNKQLPDPATSEQDNHDSSQSDYEPVNYFKDEKEKTEEPEMRQKHLRKKLLKQRLADSCGYEIPALHQAQLDKIKDKKKKKEKKEKTKKVRNSPRKSDDTESQSSQMEADDENIDNKVLNRRKKGVKIHDDDDDIITPYFTFQYPRFIDGGDIYVDSPLSSSPDFESFKLEKKRRPRSYSDVPTSGNTTSTGKKSKVYAADVPLSAVESREDRIEKESSESPFTLSPSLMRKDEVSLTEAFAKAFPSFSGDFSFSQNERDKEGGVKERNIEAEFSVDGVMRSQSPLLIQPSEKVPDKSKWRMGLSHGLGSVSPEVILSPSPTCLQSVSDNDKKETSQEDHKVNENEGDDEIGTGAKISKENQESKKVAPKKEDKPEQESSSKKINEKKNKKEKKSKGGFFFKRFERKKEAAALSQSSSSSISSSEKFKENKSCEKSIDDFVPDGLVKDVILMSDSNEVTHQISASSDTRVFLDTKAEASDEVLSQTAATKPLEESPTYENDEDITNTDFNFPLSENTERVDIQNYPDSPSVYARVKKASLAKTLSLEALNKTDETTQQQKQHRFEKTVSLFARTENDDDDDVDDIMDSAATRNIDISNDPDSFFSDSQDGNKKAPNLKSLFSESDDINFQDKGEIEEDDENEEVEYETAFPRSRLEEILERRGTQIEDGKMVSDEFDVHQNKDKNIDKSIHNNFSPDSADCVHLVQPEKRPSFETDDLWKDYSPLEIGQMTTKTGKLDSTKKVHERVRYDDESENSEEVAKPKLANRTISLPPVVPVPKARRTLPARANSELPPNHSRNENSNDNDDNDYNLVQFDDIWKAEDTSSPRLTESEDSRQILLPDRNSEMLIMPKTRKFSADTDILGMSNHINLPAKRKPTKPERKGSQREAMYLVKDSQENGPSGFHGQDDIENRVGREGSDNDDDNHGDKSENSDCGSVTDEYDHLPVRSHKTESSRQSFPPFQPVVPTNYDASSSSINKQSQRQPSTPTSPIEYTGIQKSLHMHRGSSTVYASPWTEKDIVEQLTPKLPPRRYRSSESEEHPITIPENNGLQASRLSLTSVDLGRSESVSEVTSPGSTLRKSVSLSFGMDKDGSLGKASRKSKNKRKKGAGAEESGDKEEKMKKAISFRTLTSFFRRKKSKKDKDKDDTSSTHNDNWQLQSQPEDTSTKKNHPKDKGSTKDKSSKGGKRSSKSKVPAGGAIDDESSSGPSHPGRPVCRLVRVNEDGTREVELTRQGGGRLGVLFAKGLEDGVEDGLFINSFHDRNTSKLFSGIICIGDEVLDIDGQDVHYLTLEEVKAVVGLKETMTLRIMPSTIARSIL